MAGTELEQTFIRCLMYLGAAPQKPKPLKDSESLENSAEQIDLYCKWLDYHGEVETFYFNHVVSTYGCAIRVEDWITQYFDWLKANNPPQVGDFYHRPPTPAILHACKRRTT